MIPIHPKLVHFPIVLISTAALCQIASYVVQKDYLTKTAVFLLLLGMFCTGGVLASGWYEESRLGLEHPILETHEQMALCTMALQLLTLIVCFFIRQLTWWRHVLTVGLLASMAFVLLAAHWGGVMVYQYGIGVSQP